MSLDESRFRNGDLRDLLSQRGTKDESTWLVKLLFLSEDIFKFTLLFFVITTTRYYDFRFNSFDPHFHTINQRSDVPREFHTEVHGSNNI